MKIVKRVLTVALIATIAIIIFLYHARPIITSPHNYDLLGVFYSYGRGAPHLRDAPPDELYRAGTHGPHRADYTHLVDADELMHLISQARMRRQLPIFNIGGSGEWFIYLGRRDNPEGTIRLMVGNRNVVARENGGVPMRIVRGHELWDALERMVYP